MEKNISFERLFELVKNNYEFVEDKTLYSIVDDPEKYNLYALEYDNYYSVLFCSVSEELIQNMIKFLRKNKFVVLGSVDVYGSECLYNQLKNVEALANDPSFLKLKEEVNVSKLPYGYDKESNTYYFYFISYNELISNWFTFRNEIIPQMVELCRKYNAYGTFQFHQLDNLITNKAIMNITVKGDDGKPEYVYYIDNLHVLVDSSFKDFRSTFTSISLLLKIADNQEDFDSVSNGIDLIEKGE